MPLLRKHIVLLGSINCQHIGTLLIELILLILYQFVPELKVIRTVLKVIILGEIHLILVGNSSPLRIILVRQCGDIASGQVEHLRMHITRQVDLFLWSSGIGYLLFSIIPTLLEVEVWTVIVQAVLVCHRYVIILIILPYNRGLSIINRSLLGLHHFLSHIRIVLGMQVMLLLQRNAQLRDVSGLIHAADLLSF